MRSVPQPQPSPGTAVAERIGAGFIPIRKPGKLPAKAIKETYDLEYSKDALEIHQKRSYQGSAHPHRRRRAGDAKDRRGGCPVGAQARWRTARALVPDRAVVSERQTEDRDRERLFRSQILMAGVRSPSNAFLPSRPTITSTISFQSAA